MVQGADEAVKAYEAEIKQLNADLQGKEQGIEDAQSKVEAAQKQLQVTDSELQSMKRDLQIAEEKLKRQTNLRDTEESPAEEALGGGLTELEALRYEVTALRNANGVLQKLSAKSSSTQVSKEPLNLQCSSNTIGA